MYFFDGALEFNTHQRVYNSPTSDEVAVIFVDNPSHNAIHCPEILVRATAITRIESCIITGECGWHHGLRHAMGYVEDAMFPISHSTSTDATLQERGNERKIRVFHAVSTMHTVFKSDPLCQS
ncbi:hypothetical protein V2J09_018037 [Rumex salicifolius]